MPLCEYKAALGLPKAAFLSSHALQVARATRRCGRFEYSGFFVKNQYVIKSLIENHFLVRKQQSISRSQTRLGELQERPRPVREAAAAWGQAVLVRAGEFPERLRQAVGLEHGIETEPARAARRPDQGAVDPGLELLRVPVRPGDAQGGDEMRPALVR